MFFIGPRLTKRRVSYVIALFWAFAVLSSIPDFMSNTIDADRLSSYPCKRPWSIKEYFHHKGFIIYTCIFLEIIPCLVVFLCYFEIFRGMFITKTIFSALDGPNAQTLEDWRSTKQLLKLLVWITVLFLICFLPFAVFFIYLVAVNKTTVAGNHDRLFFCHRMVLFLINANSFFNPLVYAFQSSNYRKGFKRIFCCKSVSQTNV